MRKQSFCLAGARRAEVLGKPVDIAKCQATFAKAIANADRAAAKKGTSCRWLDNGDGTATDLNSGLQWELKSSDGSVHDKNNTYTWNRAPGGTAPNGKAFTAFLGTLNDGATADGINTTGCFAGKCDWRLPTIGELRGILDAQYPNCTSNPCTTIPGDTASAPYWSSSRGTLAPDKAAVVMFDSGFVGASAGKNSGMRVRAVRGCS